MSLKLVADHNNIADNPTVHWDDFFYDVKKLPYNLREGFELAREQVKRYYVFPDQTLPWSEDYSTKQCELYGDLYREKTFQNRAYWLAEKADEELTRRKITIQKGFSTSWAVVSMAILVGTYDCMSQSNQSLLLSQGDIIGPELGISGKFKDSSISSLRKILHDNSYNWFIKEGNPKSALGVAKPEFKSNVKKLYYSRVHTRSEFCVVSIYHEARSIANRVWRYGSEKKQATLDAWEHDLGHDFELIDYFLHQKKRKSRV